MAWSHGLSDEIGHWREYITTQGGTEWSADYSRRVDPQGAVVDPLIIAALETLTSPNVSILDVGAGPLSTVGLSYRDKRISLTAVDPLADAYDEILASAGVTPPVRTISCAAEELSAHFPPGSFDIAYARNCLDHSWDPLTAIEGMLAVVKRNGVVVLRHGLQEAENGRYHGLHQWNFDSRRGRFIIWGQGVVHDVTSLLQSRAAVTCHIEDGWVLCTIKPC